METEMMFKDTEVELIFELIYDAEKSMMSGEDLGEAFIGMSKCIGIAGKTAKLNFENVYVFPIEEGSIKAKFTFTKREGRAIYIQSISGALGNIISGSFIGALLLIGQHGLSTLKSPSAEILRNASESTIELCTNAEFRRSIGKIARPISEVNQNVTIKVDEKSYVINCNNQYKFIIDDQDEILPELRNGETIKLLGTLTRMNMRNNDLGFEYKGKTLSITPFDPDKNVATEYHQFTPLPQVYIHGLIVRENVYVTPRIRVIKMLPPENAQIAIFEDLENITSSDETSR